MKLISLLFSEQRKQEIPIQIFGDTSSDCDRCERSVVLWSFRMGERQTDRFATIELAYECFRYLPRLLEPVLSKSVVGAEKYFGSLLSKQTET
ncbi:hypothetical protein ACFL27_23560 [candidate division CSSED10-310 bacterium]|uniref:Uncharacterized protein n=1 Tax=candidate division CSSED10-310 bacterium TaxID=2855610 RepID=A0ABV6Z4A7_UNCC1